MSISKNIDLIKSNIMFKDVDFTSLNFPFDTKNFEELKEDNIIYSPGQPASFIYLLIKGEVKVKMSSVKKLFVKSANDFFGETEALGNVERNSSALANSDCVLYKIDSELLKKLLAESSSLRANLLFDRSPDEDKPVVIHQKEEPVIEKPILDVKAETEKVDLSQLVDITPKYGKPIDIDKIEIKHYEQEPDLDSFIQKKYLENDNKSLKTQLIDDTDDISNWIITEQPLNVMSAKKEMTIEPPKKKISDQEIVIKANNPVPQSIRVDKIKKLIPSPDIKRVAKEILEYLLPDENSTVGAFFLYSAESEMLEEIYQTNESMQKGKYSINDGITGLVAKEKEIRFAISFLNDINYKQEVDRPNGFVGETIIFVPFLDDKNNLLGLAQIGSDETIFSSVDEQKFKEYSDYCSKILQESLSLKPDTKVFSSNLELNQISSFIMKDVKAPLLNIKHYSSLLSRFDLPEEVKKIVALLSAQTNSTIDLVQASIDYSEKNIKNKLEVVNFDEALNHILTLLSDYVESRNVRLFKKTGCDAKVKIDTRKFFVACYYISRFSCDVMKKGGNLYFSSQVEGSNALLSVKDENNFIKANHLEKIFDPTFNDDKDEKIGLSLAISKFIIESMQGTINAQILDSGTSYLVSIPILS